MISIDVPGGSLDFILPSEVAGYIVAIFINDGGESEDDDFAPTQMLPYGFFTGHRARQQAEEFGQKYITPVGNPWRVLPVQSLAMYQRIDHLRAMVTDRGRMDYGEEWTPRRCAAFFDGHGPVPGRISLDDAETMLTLLAKEGVLVRLGRRTAWAVNPDRKDS